MKSYFEDFLTDTNSYDRIRMHLDKARKEGHTAKIRNLADQTLKHLEIFAEVCEEMRKKNQ